MEILTLQRLARAYGETLPDEEVEEDSEDEALGSGGAEGDEEERGREEERVEEKNALERKNEERLRRAEEQGEERTSFGEGEMEGKEEDGATVTIRVEEEENEGLEDIDTRNKRGEKFREARNYVGEIDMETHLNNGCKEDDDHDTVFEEISQKLKSKTTLTVRHDLPEKEMPRRSSMSDAKSREPPRKPTASASQLPRQRNRPQHEALTPAKLLLLRLKTGLAIAADETNSSGLRRRYVPGVAKTMKCFRAAEARTIVEGRIYLQ